MLNAFLNEADSLRTGLVMTSMLNLSQVTECPTIVVGMRNNQNVRTDLVLSPILRVWFLCSDCSAWQQ